MVLGGRAEGPGVVPGIGNRTVSVMRVGRVAVVARLGVGRVRGCGLGRALGWSDSHLISYETNAFKALFYVGNVIGVRDVHGNLIQ